MPRAALALICLGLAAQPATTQTLAPGKPAGANTALHISYRQGFIGLSIIAVAVTFALFGSTTSTSTSTATATASTG
jgi:hypothetical protein